MVDVESAGGLHARGSPSRARQARVSVGSVAPRARAARRLPKVALGPVAVVVLLGLAWSANGGGAARERGAKRAVVNRLATRLHEGRAREDVPVDGSGTPVPVAAPSPRYDHSDLDPGAFRPFERSGDPARPRTTPRASSRARALAPTERVRQTVDDSHLPTLPPMPPASPGAPPPPAPVPDDGDAAPRVVISRAARPERVFARPREETPRERPNARVDPEAVPVAREAAMIPDASATDNAPALRDTPRPSPSPSRPKVAFYFQMANEPKATLEVVKSVREHFPDAPLYVSSDDGWDCASMCEQYLCEFTLHESSAGMHGSGGVVEWLSRLRSAAEQSRAEWLVLLEDDVRVDGPITRWPTTDAGGVEDHRWTAPMSAGLLADIARRSGKAPAYKHYGLCGGAIVSVDALATVDPKDAEEEVKAMHALDERVGKWNDVTLAALLMARGKSVAPWADLKQGNHPTHATAMTHNDKRFYGKRMAEDERGMCAPPGSKEG